MQSRTPDAIKPEVVLAHLAQAAARSPRPFAFSARVAVGTGPTDAPTWLLIELRRTATATVSWLDRLPLPVDAALFLSSDGCKVAGEQRLLSECFRHFLEGQTALALRAQLRETSR